jgi:hypothetical protein
MDDLILTGPSDKGVEKFNAEMRASFYMSDIGLLCFYWSIEVCQGDDNITLYSVSEMLCRAHLGAGRHGEPQPGSQTNG